MRFINSRSRAHLSSDPDVTGEIISSLRSRGVTEVDASSTIRAEYSSDASNYRVVPAAVVFPRSVEEVQAVQQVSLETGVSLTVRGGGTSVAGNAVGPGVILDLSRHLNKVIQVNFEEKTAVVEPGVVLDDLQRAVAHKGMRFGPDPSTHSRCTIGGMIGNNACGSHSVAFGKTAENIVSLDVIDGTGRRFVAGQDINIVPGLAKFSERHRLTITEELGRFSRQVSGFSLQHLLEKHGHNLARALVGTEGTCVLVLGATVSLVMEPPATALTVLGYQDMASAADAVMAILELRPQAVEGIDSRLVDVVKRHHRSQSSMPTLPKGGGWLFVETGGSSEAEAHAAGEAIVAKAEALESVIVPNGVHAQALWKIREDGVGLAGRTPDGRPAWPGWEDAAVPPEKLGRYLRDFQDLLSEHRLDGLMYGHFGDGCVHTRLDFPLGDQSTLFRPFLVDAARLVSKYGGSLSGEHGDGRARSELLPFMYSKNALTAFEEFKELFDPKNLLNPGIVVRSRAVDDDLRLPGLRSPKRLGGFAIAEDGGDFSSAVHRCVGIGKCRSDDSVSGSFMCPSFLATRDEKDSTRGRARVLQEMINGSLVKNGWRSPEVHEVLDLCLSCKACATDCPAGVDMAKYKSEVLYQSYRHRIRPLSHYSLGWLPSWAKLVALAPGLANVLLANPLLGRFVRGLGGVDQRRSLPRFAGKTFTSGYSSSTDAHQTIDNEVILFVDSFTDHFAPEVAKDAVSVLKSAGFAVTVSPPGLCCGITWISTGQLDIARKKLRKLVEHLFPSAANGTPIIVLEPSCAAVLRKDLVDLLDDPKAKVVSAATYTMAEILVKANQDNPNGWMLPNLQGVRVIVQPHCHQYAEIGFDADRMLLESTGAEVEALAGCCGMAGNFGMEKGHYEVSVLVAKNSLLPAIDRAASGTVIVADGFSCRTQISDLRDWQSLHLVQLLAHPPCI